MTFTTEIAPFRIDIRQFRARRPARPAGAHPSGPTSCPASAGRTASRGCRTCGNWPSTGAAGTTGEKHEAALNEYPQFTTEIDGQNIHFLHVRSPQPDTLPLVLTHGWPGSIVEFTTKVIGPLTDPPAHGGDPRRRLPRRRPVHTRLRLLQPDPREPAGTLHRVARAWAELMSRLGYERYGARGGDSGSVVSPPGSSAASLPDRVVGVHVNGPAGLPPFPLTRAGVGHPVRPGKRPGPLGSRGVRSQERVRLHRRSSRPVRRPCAYGLTDSPVGQLAWLMDKLLQSAPARAKPCRKRSSTGTRLLTDAMIYSADRHRRLGGVRRLRPGVRLGRPEAELRCAHGGDRLRPRRRHPPLRRDREHHHPVGGRLTGAATSPLWRSPSCYRRPADLFRDLRR